VKLIIHWLILKVIQLIEYIWLIAAMIPLFIGIIMIDILLKAFKVEKPYLLMVDFSAWCTLISRHLEYLKIQRIQKIQNNSNNTGDINYV